MSTSFILYAPPDLIIKYYNNLLDNSIGSIEQTTILESQNPNTGEVGIVRSSHYIKKLTNGDFIPDDFSHSTIKYGASDHTETIELEHKDNFDELSSKLTENGYTKPITSGSSSFFRINQNLEVALVYAERADSVRVCGASAEPVQALVFRSNMGYDLSDKKHVPIILDFVGHTSGDNLKIISSNLESLDTIYIVKQLLASIKPSPEKEL